MAHPAISAVERYYALYNEGRWPLIPGMFDLPALLLVGSRKVLLNTTESVAALYQGLVERSAREGTVRISWDREGFAIFQVHDDLAVVKTALTREAADGTPIKTWNCSYTLRLVGSDWLFTLISSDDTTRTGAAS